MMSTVTNMITFFVSYFYAFTACAFAGFFGGFYYYYYFRSTRQKALMRA